MTIQEVNLKLLELRKLWLSPPEGRSRMSIELEGRGLRTVKNMIEKRMEKNGQRILL